MKKFHENHDDDDDDDDNFDYSDDTEEIGEVDDDDIDDDPRFDAWSKQNPPTYNASHLYFEDPVQKKRRRRRRRRRRMAVGAAGGFLVGIFVFGPVGATVGVFTGAVVARGITKIGEMRKDRRVKRELARLQQVSS